MIRGGGGGKGLNFTSCNASLDTMLLCVDLVLRGKSLKWWKTTNSWHRGLMGPSSLPARKWPTCAPSSPPPAVDWQSWVPAAPLAWRTTTNTTTTMTAFTTGVSAWMCAHSHVISCLCVCERARTGTCVSVLKSAVGSILRMCSGVTNIIPPFLHWLIFPHTQHEKSQQLERKERTTECCY